MSSQRQDQNGWGQMYVSCGSIDVILCTVRIMSAYGGEKHTDEMK